MESKPRGNSSESRGNSNLKLRIRIRRGQRIRANSGRIRIRANSCEFEPASLVYSVHHVFQLLLKPHDSRHHQSGTVPLPLCLTCMSTVAWCRSKTEGRMELTVALGAPVTRRVGMCACSGHVVTYKDLDVSGRVNWSRSAMSKTLQIAQPHVPRYWTLLPQTCV